MAVHNNSATFTARGFAGAQEAIGKLRNETNGMV